MQLPASPTNLGTKALNHAYGYSNSGCVAEALSAGAVPLKSGRPCGLRCCGRETISASSGACYARVALNMMTSDSQF